MDIAGPLERFRSGYRYILVVHDYATLHRSFSSEVNYCSGYRPCSLGARFQGRHSPRNSDRPRYFFSFSDLTSGVYLLGIKRIKTTLYQPQTDGLVKRYNQTLKAMLKMRKTGIVGCCICFSFTGRSLTLQKATHPFLFSSIQMREKMEQVTTLVHANMEAAQKRQKDLFDKTTKVRVFQPGQEVSLLLPTTDNKLLAKWQSSQENGICYADTIGRRSRSIMSISSKNGNPKLFKTASSLWLEL